jgi:SAM-dependent methyltransferase
VFIDPQPTAREIEDLYAEEYFTECSEACGAHGREAYMEMAEQSGAERVRSAAKLDRLLRRHAAGRGALLEVGCGPGFLLLEMRKLGWAARGLEISAYAARYAREQLGIDVAVGPLETQTVPRSSVDAVFMGDVLEHLPQPIAALRAVRTWLKPQGIVLIAVPATLNLLSAKLGMVAYSVLRKSKTMRIPPYHLFEYTPQTLRRMITASGFTVLELRESAVPLRKMGLRGTAVENIGKISLQLCAHLTTRLVNRWGDRLLAVARK